MAFTHGMVSLEIDGRFPPQADLDEAWRAGLAAFTSPAAAFRRWNRRAAYYGIIGAFPRRQA